MKAQALNVLLLLLVYYFQAPPDSRMSQGSMVIIKRSSEYTEDTAGIVLLAKQGLKFISNPVYVREAKVYLDSAMRICDRRHIEVPAIVNLLGAEYSYSVGDLRGASEEATQAISKSSETNDYVLLAKTCTFFGRYYNRIGFYKESLENYDKAIQICEKQSLKGMIPDNYYGKSTVYKSLNDLKGAREALNSMIVSAQKEKNIWPVISGYYYYSYTYLGDSVDTPGRDFHKGDSLLKKCIYYASSVNDSAWLCGALANTGWNFYLQKMYDSSIYYYQRSLRYSIPAGRIYTTVNSYGNLGTIYRDLGKYGMALDYYNKALDQTKGDEEDNLRNLWWIYRDMSDLYLGLKDTARAYENYVLFKKYSDINGRKENSKGLADARVRYEADSHRKEVELLSLRLKNNRLLNFGLGIFIVLSVIIGLLILRSYRLKNKRRISEMNRKISEVTQANLRQQMNPHFIFNTLNSIQYYMYQHDKLATNNYLTKFSALMRKVLENSRHTSVPLSDEISALNLYLELECIRFKDKFDFKITIDDEIDPLMYKIPTMLIQPYVENSITHGLMPMEGKGFVNIDIRMNGESLLCTIEDNGIGRKASRERNLKKEPNHNSLGTQITESRLDLVNSLYGTSLKTHYTDLTNEKGEASGTRVEIHIPIIA